MKKHFEVMANELRKQLESSQLLYWFEHIVIFSVCATASLATGLSVLLLLAALRHPTFLSKQPRLPTRAVLLSSLSTSTGLDQDEVCPFCRDSFEGT